MTLQELTEAVDQLEQLPPHVELMQLRALLLALAAKCVEVTDLRHPGMKRLIDRCIERETKLSEIAKQVNA